MDSRAVVGEPLAGGFVSLWDSTSLDMLRRRDPNAFRFIAHTLAVLGEGSMRAQGIAKVLTSADIILTAPEYRVYLHMIPPSSGAGGAPLTAFQPNAILKMGTKRLFLATTGAPLREYSPLCVLDFFVSTTEQRRGVGRALFDYMLAREAAAPQRLAYDRPSPKLCAFLAKHFSLAAPIHQTNRFMVFPPFFRRP
eukprot:TRINITY_DN3251_c0_g1_i2.p2 TRINITY_DN3251_c0_g1~~TRINITY_DN3251_c0_g1_i2.p2  ORF type:complete len:195 (-),score=6.95 TRINITY_DN3251_c0_g1_i2:821-1405(-)